MAPKVFLSKAAYPLRSDYNSSSNKWMNDVTALLQFARSWVILTPWRPNLISRWGCTRMRKARVSLNLLSTKDRCESVDFPACEFACRPHSDLILVFLSRGTYFSTCNRIGIGWHALAKVDYYAMAWNYAWTNRWITQSSYALLANPINPEFIGFAFFVCSLNFSSLWWRNYKH